MAQQDTPQAQAASAATTEAGFTLFTHLARAPRIPESHPSQRYFFYEHVSKFGESEVCALRHESNDYAKLSIGTSSERSSSYAEISTRITADQCEALGRALLDAAHDLRTHSANQLMVNTILEMTEGGAS